MPSVHDLADGALQEIRTALLGTDREQIERLVTVIAGARRIVVYGLGREGLALRTFAMRLMHLGLDVHLAGDTTAAPVTSGDLVLVSTGPGDLAMVRTLMGLARERSATIVALTAQPEGPDLALADHQVFIPAQTMANDLGGDAAGSVLPMGSVYELAMTVLLDLVVLLLMERTGQSLEDLRARHFNLE